MRQRLTGLGLMALAVAIAAPAQASAAAKKRCYTVSAEGTGMNRDGKTDVTFSKDPWLRGDATGGFAIVAGAAPKFEITTYLTFNTKHGKLTVDTAGTMDIATGEFQSKGPIKRGTKRFKGATGAIEFVGLANIATGAFTDTATGRVCLSKTSSRR